MPRKNRAYKKGAPHRDARLFVIVAEGEREDEYFEWFHQINLRIKVQIVPREKGESAPKHFFKRVQAFINNGHWSEKDDDQLWFVVDVDRWKREAIDALQDECDKNSNWHIAISNPCFEVWLIYHLRSSILGQGESCTDLKKQLATLVQGGYSPDKICPLIETGTINSKDSDTHPQSYFPDRMQTKVYLLAEQMLELLGANWK